jgi:hypothetical protein
MQYLTDTMEWAEDPLLLTVFPAVFILVRTGWRMPDEVLRILGELAMPEDQKCAHALSQFLDVNSEPIF